MNGKTAIVTGTSSGFGLLSVIELALKGFTVIATMRDINKAAPLWEKANQHHAAEKIHVHALDVTSLDSIKQLNTLLSELPTVDVLVNNAGYALGGFSEELNTDDYRRQFETNFFGVIAVTQAVLPYMRAKGQGRIINMSSISGKVGFPGLSAYVSSKHALEGYSESLRLELKPFGIDVSLIEPGSYHTNIWSGIDQVALKEHSPYYSYLKNLLKEIKTGKSDFGNPEEVAKLVAAIACLPSSPKLRYPIGKGIKRNILFKNLLRWEWLEKIILKKLNANLPGNNERKSRLR